MLLFLTLATASSSYSSSNVTRSWQNDRETTSSTYDWTGTTASTADNFTGNATKAILTTSEPSITSFWQYHACVSWFKVGSPILMVLATVGNTISLITLQNPELHHEFYIKTMVLGMPLIVIKVGYFSIFWSNVIEKKCFAVLNQKHTYSLQNPMFHKSSTSFLLSALAFSDLGTVNITLLSTWIIVSFGIDIRRMTSFGCKTYYFLVYYSHHVSGILIKLLSHARYSKPT